MGQPLPVGEPPFDLESIAWSDVMHWTTKDYDFGYDLRVHYKPGFIMDHQMGTSFHAEGKPYPVWVNYCVIGHKLLIWSKRPGEEFTEFHSKLVIDLRKVDVMTQSVISRRKTGFLFVDERPVYTGEQFFFMSSDPGMPAYQRAFTLRFPENHCVYQWEDAVKFSSSLKWRICKLRLAPSKLDGHSN